MKTFNKRFKHVSPFLIRFLRVKNMFEQNKRESNNNKNNNWLYNYADIKFNMLMEYKDMSMVCY